mmetsp:Transcript_7989/g.13401  ORF Transcript_7989/g.13401 Transcript_7989/m.13401 type:complete len:396 (+) Transcript_7989:3-1190(+)
MMGIQNRNGHLVGYQGHKSTSNYSNNENYALQQKAMSGQGNQQFMGGGGMAGQMNNQMLHGAHSRRSGSSKPKKKGQNQPIKIIKNINNNNYIFNNPQIEIQNPQMLGGHIIQAQHYHGNPNSQASKNGQYGNGMNGITVIKENNIVMNGNIAHGMMGSGHLQGGTHTQPTNMMGRRLADQNQNSQNNNGLANISLQGNQPLQNPKSQSFVGQAMESQNAIMGISGGMVRLKGNSPKVSGKDSNRPRGIKNFTGSSSGNSTAAMSAGVGGVSSIGTVNSGVINSQNYGVRSIHSQKGINRPQTNNLMMSQQVMGSSHLNQTTGNQNFANSQILNQQQLGIFKGAGPIRATAFDYKMEQIHGMQSSGQMIGGRKQMNTGTGHGSQKSYKRGGNTVG